MVLQMPEATGNSANCLVLSSIGKDSNGSVKGLGAQRAFQWPIRLEKLPKSDSKLPKGESKLAKIKLKAIRERKKVLK